MGAGAARVAVFLVTLGGVFVLGDDPEEGEKRVVLNQGDKT